MLIMISRIRRAVISQVEMRFEPAAVAWANVIISVILTRWSHILSTTEAMVLMTIIRLTAGRGFPAEEVTVGQLSNCLNISERTVQRCIEALCREDFVNIYAVESMDKGREFAPRIFEINCKTVLKDIELSPRNTPSPPAEMSGGGDKFAGGAHIYIHRYFVPSLISLYQESAGSAAEIETGVEKMKQLATPKKPRHTSNLAEKTTETIQGVIEAQQMKRVAVAAVRIAEVEIDFNSKNLQAFLDSAMSSYFPALPRMIVTIKPFSVMKKRLKESGIVGPQVKKFINDTLRDWTTISANSRAVYMKDPGRKGSPIPDTPTFATLAYKLPYFLAVYASGLTPGVSKNDNALDVARKQIANLQTQLTQERQSTAAVLRRRSGSSMQINTTATPMVRRGSTTPPTQQTYNDELPDADIPEWTQRRPNQNGK